MVVLLEQWISKFWFQEPFTFLKITEDFKELLFMWVCLPIFTVLEIKIEF